jgi:hypothetical protein
MFHDIGSVGDTTTANVWDCPELAMISVWTCRCSADIASAVHSGEIDVQSCKDGIEGSIVRLEIDIGDIFG